MISSESQDYGLALITGTWDDLPTLMDRLGYSYKNLGNALAVFQDPSVLQGVKAVYIACGAECAMNDMATHHLRQFVAGGGGLYISDMAAAAVERLFPGQVTFTRLDYKSDNAVHVIDPGMIQLLGTSISLHMDYQNSQGIQSVAQGVQVLIQGPRQDFDTQDFPYLVSFRHGKGQVLYTVFHNAHQVDETEEKLLRYLILRPILTTVHNQALELATPAVEPRSSILPVQILSAVQPEQGAESYTIRTRRPGSIRLVLAWEGKASFAIRVTHAGGKLVKYQSSDLSPLVIDVPAPNAGEWGCHVKGINIPAMNFPFVLIISHS